MDEEPDPLEIDENDFLVDADGNKINLPPDAIGLNSLEEYIKAGGNPFKPD